MDTRHVHRGRRTIIDTFDEHEAMSMKALNSDQVRAGLKELLLGPVQLYAALRARNAPKGGRASQESP